MPSLSLLGSATPRPRAVLKVRFSPDRAYLAAAVEGGEVLVYDAARLPALRLVQALRPSPAGATVRDVAFSRDAGLLAVACYDCSIYVYRLMDAEEVAGTAAGWTGELDRIVQARRVAAAADPGAPGGEEPAPEPMYAPASVIEKGHSKEVKSVAVSRAGRIASCSRDRVVSVWGSSPDAPLDYECLAYLDGHTQDIKHVAFNNSGDMLLSASYDNRVQVYRRSIHPDPEGLEPIEEWELFSVAASPVRPETYSTDPSVVRAAAGSCHTVWSAEFSPRGGHVLAVDGNGCKRLYRVEENACHQLCADYGGHGARACYDLSVLDLAGRGGEGELASAGAGERFLAFTCGADNSLEISLVRTRPGPGAGAGGSNELGALPDGEEDGRMIRLLARAPHAHMGEVNTVASAWVGPERGGEGRAFEFGREGASMETPGSTRAFIVTGGDDGRINVWGFDLAGSESGDAQGT